MRIGLVHSVLPAIGAVESSFARLWPEPERASLYDQSLYLDLGPNRSLTPAIYARIDALLRHSAEADADAILVTGSLFGPAVEKARAALRIPVLTSFEGIIDAAFAAGTRFGLIATDPGTNRMLEADLKRHAVETEKSIEIEAVFVDGAMKAVNAGDQETHDRLVVDASETLA